MKWDRWESRELKKKKSAPLMTGRLALDTAGCAYPKIAIQLFSYSAIQLFSSLVRHSLTYKLVADSWQISS
jgi:hypothetical protein